MKASVNGGRHSDRDVEVDILSENDTTIEFMAMAGRPGFYNVYVHSPNGKTAVRVGAIRPSDVQMPLNFIRALVPSGTE